MNLYDLDTPALIVDLDRLETNIERMARVTRDGGKALRPHTKTHKTPEIARMQLAAGAHGITVAKLGEAEVMAGAGFSEIDDIFVANQIVGAVKIERLIALSRRARIIVGADSPEAVVPIAEAARRAGIDIPIRIEVDTGLNRAGVRTVAAAIDLGGLISRTPGVHLDGIYTHEGHVNACGVENQQRTCSEVARRMRETAHAMRDSGIDPGIVSVGSTAGAPLMAREEEIDEIRAGVYVFNDRGQVQRGGREEDCALTILATVVSRPDETTAIVDSGTKSLSGDRSVEASKFGQILGEPGVIFDWANEEHGHLNLSDTAFRPKILDRLRIVPFHACTATNMHDTIYGVRGERVETTWKIAARGKIQ